MTHHTNQHLRHTMNLSFFSTETTLELAVANSNNFDYGSADYSRNGLIALSISLPMHFNALMIRFDENIYSTCFYLPITYSCILPHLYFLQWFCLSFCTEITSQPPMCGIFRHRLRYWAIYNGQVHLLFMRNLCYIKRWTTYVRCIIYHEQKFCQCILEPHNKDLSCSVPIFLYCSIHYHDTNTLWISLSRKKRDSKCIPLRPRLNFNLWTGQVGRILPLLFNL